MPRQLEATLKTKSWSKLVEVGRIGSKNAEIPKNLRAMPDIRTGSFRFQLVQNKTSWTGKSLANRFG